MSRTQKGDNRRMISVVVPVYNEPDGVRRTLQSLVDQQANNEEYEVVVVDNNSTDETGDVIEEFEANVPEIVTAVEEREIQSSYAARNTGIEETNGEVLAFLDADMHVDETYISDVAEYMDETDADYVGLDVSLVADGEGDSIPGTFNALTGFPVERYLQAQQYAPTCCLVVRREVVESIGGFDDRLRSGGDKVFGKLASNAGFEQEFCDQLTVYHPLRDTTREMLRKAVRIGRGATQLDARYPELDGNRSIHDLRSYLPPDPRRLLTQESASSQWGMGGLLRLYLFATAFKYARLYGVFTEWLSR